MLLDRIDIDAHGPLHRVELGPLAEHLNVVFAPDGSGKTAISRFIRDALVGSQLSAGHVQLLDRPSRVGRTAMDAFIATAKKMARHMVVAVWNLNLAGIFADATSCWRTTG